jgi:hypothetical protein
MDLGLEIKTNVTKVFFTNMTLYIYREGGLAPLGPVKPTKSIFGNLKPTQNRVTPVGSVCPIDLTGLALSD